ncbi:cell division protein FtsA [Pelagibacterales bacterium SAG-MED31]|nr:cell division protein FtsA [Pelagibacterales bacterium SAG-MED31]
MIKVGLNIGNSNISCAVVEIKDNKDTKLLSCESYPSKILKKNIITNFEELLTDVKSLIYESEKKSQTKINSINLNIPVIDSISKYYDSEIENLDHQITELDVKKAINNSDYFIADENYYEIFNNIYGYVLDNNLISNSPIGNYAYNLKLLFYKILIPHKILKSYKNLIDKMNIKIDSYVPTPLSSSLAVLSNDEKMIGSICIDLGHSNTSISIFENNKFIYGDSILVGSNNITNDIARGVSTTLDSAERLKTLYSSLISAPSDEYEIIEVPTISGENDKFVQINRLQINSIVKPRVEETLEMVWQKLKQNNLHKKQIKNVVLTGGGAQLEGISQYAELIFSSNVRIGLPKEDFINFKNSLNSGYADVIGCSFYKPDIFLDKIIEKQGKKQKRQGFKGFFNWLDQYI